MRSHGFLLALVGLVFLAQPGATAEAIYALQPVLKGGDPVGSARIRPGGWFYVEGLNDSGQLVVIKVVSVGPGAGQSGDVAMNGKGQVAVTVRIAGGSDMVVLLTPPAP